MLIVVAAGIFGLLVTSRTAAYQGLHHYLLSLAEVASTVVDPVLHNEIRRPEQLNDADYVRAVTEDVGRLVAQRVLTKEDGDALIAEAKSAAVPF